MARYQSSLTTTFLALLASVIAPDAFAQTAPPTDLNWAWPLYNKDDGLPRPAIYNVHGEYQNLENGIDVHPGIDVLGNAGDIVHFPEAGRIVYVSNPGSYTTAGQMSRIWVQPASSPYLYYVAHLHDESTLPTDNSLDSVRTAANDASASVRGQPLSTVYEVARESVAGVIATWPGKTLFHHVHLGVYDTTDRYASLDPLFFLGRTTGGMSIVDDEPPTLRALSILDAVTGTEITSTGFCGTEVTGPVDLILDAVDTFYTNTPTPTSFAAQDDAKPNTCDIFGAAYRAHRIGDVAVPASHQWYESPAGCISTGCGLWRLRSRAEIQPLVELEEWFTSLVSGSEDGAPTMMGGDIDDLLWRTTSTEKDWTESSSSDVHFHHILNNDVSENGGADHDWNAPGDALPSGRYVVTASAWDQAGNPASTSLLVTVNNDGLVALPADLTGWQNIYVRDHAGDIGQLPSNQGGEPFWGSDDIIVTTSSGSPINCAAASSLAAPLEVGKSYSVYVRVRNNGCVDVSSVGAAVYSATPSTSLINLVARSTQTDYEAGTTTVPAGGVACIGPFEFTPTTADLDGDQTGHRCLIAAVNAPSDPGPAYATAGEWKVVENNNVAQRNIQISDLHAELMNKGPTETSSTLVFDMGGFPADSARTSAYFDVLVENKDNLAAVWLAQAANTDAYAVVGWELVNSVSYLRVSLKKGKVRLPAWTFPGVSQRRLLAQFLLPAGAGNYDVVMHHYLGSTEVGGMVFRTIAPDVPK